MAKLTRSDKEKIVKGLVEVFQKYEADDSVLFYYDGVRAKVDSKTGKLVVEYGFNPRDYFDYCNENTVSISFDGSPIYEILNGYASPELFESLHNDIENVIEPFGLYYELGNTWNLSLYDINPDNGNDPEPREEPIYIGIDSEVPEELKEISLWWKEKADAYGDHGSCVIGAGFKFQYQGKSYFMPPLTGWQGSCSWEAFVNEVQAMLESIGATNIVYNWGVMD